MKYPLFFIIFLLVSCRENSWEVKKDSDFSQLVKQTLGKRLPVLEKINFYELMGRVPSDEELELGRNLFNDTVLSRNNDVSCATCHLSNHGFADGNPLSVGTMGVGGPNGDDVGRHFGEGVLSVKRTLGDDGFARLAYDHMFRNSLSTVNVAYRINKSTNQGLFWDGRFGDLLFQVLLPVHTVEEMCGSNPISLLPNGKNLFAAGGIIFDKPVKIYQTNSFDAYTGRNTNNFNGQPEVVTGIPYKRADQSVSIPTRNECLALSLAKISKIPYYKKSFEKVYGKGPIDDRLLAKALASFVLTHVSQNSPYDRFLKGEVSLNNGQLAGLASFFTPIGKEIVIGDRKIKGGGCFECHSGATFGGIGYASLGVRSDIRSSLGRAKNRLKSDSGFFDRPRTQRGLTPNCHIDGVSVSINGYAPDIGYARVSLKKDDCFKMRVPPLRNVLETFPYFHHGSESAQGFAFDNFKKRSLKGLENVIRYHLRGPVNIKQLNRMNPLKPFYDDLFQLDPFIPYFSQNFLYKGMHPMGGEVSRFPVQLSEREIANLVSFVGEGLLDPDAVVEGALGNDVSHPKQVPSGLEPSISRDEGTQLDWIPR